MSNEKGNVAVKRDSTDILLWMGGLVIAGLGASWLVLSQPWSTGDGASPPPIAPQDAPPSPAPPLSTPRAPQAELETTLDSPLRMAKLAYEAGMLVEPQDYSAWALFQKVLDEDPENAEAANGLGMVADVLVSRADVALEQGRFEDVRDIVERIRATLPEHDGVDRLAADLEELAPQVRVAAPLPEPALPSTQPQIVKAVQPEPQPRPVVEQAAEPQPPPVDPIVALRESFEGAMADNRLLTPRQESAKDFLDQMLSIDPRGESSLAARQVLFDAFLDRATEAVETLDTQAAETWIGEAETLNVNDYAVQQARNALRDRLVAMESMRLLPVAELELVEYALPRYPAPAADRGVEGWVEVEFTVGLDGKTRDIVVAEASHESFFRDEAVDAVEKWEFKPRVFMDQSIEQRTFVRMRFALDEG